MENILKTGDVIFVDNKDRYYVAASVVYDEVEYADLVKYPEDPQDLLIETKHVRKIVKLINKNGEVFIDVVEDKTIQEKVRKAGEPKIVDVKKLKKTIIL